MAYGPTRVQPLPTVNILFLFTINLLIGTMERILLPQANNLKITILFLILFQTDSYESL